LVLSDVIYVDYDPGLLWPELAPPRTLHVDSVVLMRREAKLCGNRFPLPIDAF
jgi:hypothetical protein